jgi:hypothetical protein
MVSKSKSFLFLLFIYLSTARINNCTWAYYKKHTQNHIVKTNRAWPYNLGVRHGPCLPDGQGGIGGPFCFRIRLHAALGAVVVRSLVRLLFLSVVGRPLGYSWIWMAVLGEEG